MSKVFWTCTTRLPSCYPKTRHRRPLIQTWPPSQSFCLEKTGTTIVWALMSCFKTPNLTKVSKPEWNVSYKKHCTKGEYKAESGVQRTCHFSSNRKTHRSLWTLHQSIILRTAMVASIMIRGSDSRISSSMTVMWHLSRRRTAQIDCRVEIGLETI